MVRNFHYEILATLILGPSTEVSELKEQLAKLGDCLDISQYQKRLRIHIHASDLESQEKIKLVLEKAGELQDFSSVKEDWRE